MKMHSRRCAAFLADPKLERLLTKKEVESLMNEDLAVETEKTVVTGDTTVHHIAQKMEVELDKSSY